MTLIARLLTIALLLLPALPVQGRTVYQNDAEMSNAARQAFEETLDIWRAGRFDELYERTHISGRISREEFARKLENAARKPACCWQKLQDVSARVERDDLVVVKAKVGLEGGGDIEYRTRSYRLVHEGDRWKISQADIFNLAGTKGKKKGSKAKKNQ
jgi:hypothetical protein